MHCAEWDSLKPTVIDALFMVKWIVALAQLWVIHYSFSFVMLNLIN